MAISEPGTARVPKPLWRDLLIAFGLAIVVISCGVADQTATPAEIATAFVEAYSALDVETERQLWERLFRHRSGVTSLVVSHRHPALQRADQIIVMEGGRVAAVGRLDDLMASSPEFRALWEAEK